MQGAMCGTSAFGLVSKYSLPLEALSKLAWSDGEVNDGMVGLHSCQVHTLGKSYEDAFYEACKIYRRVVPAALRAPHVACLLCHALSLDTLSVQLSTTSTQQVCTRYCCAATSRGSVRCSRCSVHPYTAQAVMATVTSTTQPVNP